MALTPDEQKLVDELKRRIGETDRSDEELLALLTVYANDVNKTAAEIWSEKAASYAGLIDISEGSSTRRLSQLHSQAAAMAKRFSEASTPIVPETNRPYTAPILRGGE